MGTTKFEAEIAMWEGIFDRYPEVFQGEVYNDLPTVNGLLGESNQLKEDIKEIEKMIEKYK